MRRKSERNKVRSPDKKVEKTSRRTRRRRGTPDSEDEPQSDTEIAQTSQEDIKPNPETITKNPSTDSKESNSNSDEETKEQSVWQVKSAETPSETGEIQKLKICLQRPSSIERSPRKGHHGSSQESADSSEDVMKKRSKKHYHSNSEPKPVEATVEEQEIKIPISNSEDNVQTQPEVQNEVKVESVEENVISTDEKILTNNKEQVTSEAKEETVINDKDSEVSPVEIKSEAVVDNAEDQTKLEVFSENTENEAKSEAVSENTIVENKVINDSEHVDVVKQIDPKKEIQEETENQESAAVEKDVEPEKVIVEEANDKEDTPAPTESKEEVPIKENTTESPKRKSTEKMETDEKQEEETQTKKPRRNSRFDARSPEKSETTVRNTETNSCTVESMNSVESASTNSTDTEKVPRKRRWGSKRTISTDKKPVVAISTDSLKNLISDVKPLSINDVQLEVRKDKGKSDNKIDVKLDSKDDEKPLDKPEKPSKPEKYDDEEQHSDSEHSDEYDKKRSRSHKNDVDKSDTRSENRTRRKISVNENIPVKQTSNQTKNKPSEVLYITNLVRPFTVLQLKGLLARTGKLAENGFWIDNIKSKCFVHYENEDQAVETRHALHGTRWPASNPKLLQVEFSTLDEMEKCVSSVPPPPPVDTARRTIDNDRVAMAWLTEQNFKDDRIRDREALRDKKQSVREWDMGKQDPSSMEGPEKFPRDVPIEYPREAISRERREDRYDVRDKRRSRSRSPVRRFKRKEEEAPAKRLDDLFRKTKITPCIYWLPLTPEQISVKEEMRRQHMAEHERRKEEIRRQERERESRHGHRDKSNSNRERDREHRPRSTHNSRSGDRNNH